MALDRNALVGAINRRKQARTGQQQMQKMNSKRNQLYKPENTQATDNMPQIKKRQPVPAPTSRVESPQQRKVGMPGAPFNPQAAKTNATQNQVMAKKLNRVRNGG